MVWFSYAIRNDDVYLVVGVDWRATQNGPIFHHDDFRYNLKDRAVIGKGPTGVAAMIEQDVRDQARIISAGLAVYAGVSAALTVPQNTVVEIP